jgi:nitrite reductase/ring-hydroxylating ferredoxin subunit
MDQTRRDLLMASGAVLTCACAAAGLPACAVITGKSDMPFVPPEALRLSGGKLVIDLARVPALAAAGGSAKVVAPGTDRKVCIVRSAEDQFEAFFNRCTHGGRELEYRHGEHKLRCVSFGHSEFDLEGRKLAGPAKGNLTKLAVSRTGDSLEIAI